MEWAQPNFAQAQANNNIIFRTPTPTFGAGLLENLDDSTLIAVQRAVAGNAVGVSGTFNHTAPLWGLGQRVFFLHDGRTTNLIAAVSAHQSNGSEATQVVHNFQALTRDQQQSVLNFLRSL